jgi:hypothetical protein
MDPLMVGAMGCPAWDVTMGPYDRQEGGWISCRSRPGACLASRRCCDIHTLTASTPVTHASLTSLHPPYAAAGNHAPPLRPQRHLPGELATLLLSSGSAVEGEDQLAHVSEPIPAPALHAIDRHHPWHVHGQ